ncbi:hypothetical protein GCM10010320_26680 [Streptomyces caelestis]|nr:hypothetical protein GCM10010320_26680 [Streptomyces caelestis]
MDSRERHQDLRDGRQDPRDEAPRAHELAPPAYTASTASGRWVVYHIAPSWLPGGLVGVDVFFALSGYLITDLLCTERRRTGRGGEPRAAMGHGDGWCHRTESESWASADRSAPLPDL